MQVSDEDLQKLKSSADSAYHEFELSSISVRSSAYLAVETIKQLRVTTRNNILFTLLGGLLGFISSISVSLITQNQSKEELKQLHKQLLEVERKLDNFQTYRSKKDSLQIFSKKN
ncbi:MAG: hypothetical protein Q7T12_01945 [Flavobacterium sp.]|nr:hypothetical protein [Flavobacterium sp.]